MIIKYLAMILMLVGLIGTLSPRIPGTIIIMVGALFYSLLVSYAGWQSGVIVTLVSLIILAEVGGRVLRIYLTRQFKVSRSFSTNTTISNVAGLLATDALFGPMLGTLIWEMIIGKTLLPRWNTVYRVIVRLVAAALLRFTCGIIMIIVIIKYIFI